MWIRTDPEQHMNKSTALDENEFNVIQNVPFEHEDEQANPKCNATWHVTTDSDENYRIPLAMIQILNLDTLHLMIRMNHIQLMMSLLKNVLFKKNFKNLLK